jgi:integrase
MADTGTRTTRKREHGEGTIYYDAKAGLWRAELMVGRTPDGRVDRRRVKAKTQREARAKLQQLRQQHATGALTEPGAVTVKTFFTDWLETHVRRKSTSTYTQYESLIRVHLLPVLGGKRLKDVQPRHLQALYHALETGGRAAGYERRRLAPGQRHALGLAPKTIRDLHIAVHAGFERAARLQNLIPRNPADAVELPRTPRKKPLRLGVADVQRFLAGTNPASDRRAHLWTFLLNTGLRVSEALALRWELVDLEARSFYVEENLERDHGRRVVAGDPKTMAGYRPVPLTDAALAALRAQHRQQAADRAQLGADYQDNGLVFATSLGTPDNRDNVRRAIKAAARRVGLPNLDAFTTHDTRRLCASILRASGVRIEVAMAILGHRCAAMLLEVYAGALSEEAARAAERFQRYVYGPQEADEGRAPPGGQP